MCLSVTTLAAASFSSTIKLSTVCGASTFYSLHFQLVDLQKKCFVQKLWRHLLTVTISDGIAATPVSFFPTEDGSDVVKRRFPYSRISVYSSVTQICTHAQ